AGGVDLRPSGPNQRRLSAAGHSTTMRATFTGADAAAAKAYIAAANAVVRLQASADDLETHLERCSGFAVGQAYAAFIMALSGAPHDAARRAGLARNRG